MIAGSPGEVTRVVAHVRREAYAGFKVVAACILDQGHENVTAIDGILALAGPRIAVRPVSGLPRLPMDEPEFKGLRRAFKQLLDVPVAGLLLMS